MIKDIKNSFQNRLFSAGFWSLGGHGMSQVLRLGSNLIMTRLLVPEMFGIMVIANMIMVALALFSDVGLGQNIIRSKRGDDPIFLNTVWSVQIVRGIVIWIFALIVSSIFYYVNYFGLLTGNTVYSDPILPSVIAVISFTAVISGFESTRLPSAIRRYDQKTITSIIVFSQVIAFLSMIAWVLLIDRNIWALVTGNIIGSFTKVIFTHTLLPGIPNRWKWESEAIKEIFHFGKWVFLSSLITFLFINGDKILLGGMISADSLGIYSLALMMINVFQTAISKLISATAFPAMSEAFHQNKGSLKNIYYKFKVWIDILILFIVGVLIIAGDSIVNFLYDERYTDAGPILQILSLILLSDRYLITERYFLAIGKPKLLAILNIIRVVVFYTLVPLGFYLYNFEGALWMIVISYFSGIPVLLYLKAKHHIIDIKKELITLPVFPISIVLSALIVLLIK